jgi:hypothetical protein
MYDKTHDLALDPQPQYPTAEEIALAERLRKKIEERYLGTQNEDGHGSDEPRPFRKAA